MQSLALTARLQHPSQGICTYHWHLYRSARLWKQFLSWTNLQLLRTFTFLKEVGNSPSFCICLTTSHWMDAHLAMKVAPARIGFSQQIFHLTYACSCLFTFMFNCARFPISISLGCDYAHLICSTTPPKSHLECIDWTIAITLVCLRFSHAAILTRVEVGIPAT